MLIQLEVPDSSLRPGSVLSNSKLSIKHAAFQLVRLPKEGERAIGASKGDRINGQVVLQYSGSLILSVQPGEKVAKAKPKISRKTGRKASVQNRRNKKRDNVKVRPNSRRSSKKTRTKSNRPDDRGTIWS